MPAEANPLPISLRRLLEPALRNVEFYQRRRIILGCIAIVAFPFYYFVWTHLYPQTYENLALRLVGAGLFVPLMFSPQWPKAMKRFLPAAWYLALFYSLPFFFTYMMMKNNAMPVWVESWLVAIFAMILLLDWFSLVLHFVLGVLVAWVAYLLTTDAPLAIASYGEHALIALFAVIFGAASNFATARVRAGQERAMLATAGSVAHELRTPLISIKAGAGGVRNHLPLLLDAYALAKAQGLSVTVIRESHLEGLRGVLDRIEREADYSNAIIDMLVANVASPGNPSRELETCFMQSCIDWALQRYPFAEAERDLVHVEGKDFCFQGDDLLMVHVFFNLIKNALRHIARQQRGEITIRLSPGATSNTLNFHDNGSGIPSDVLPHVFERFYSGDGDDVVLGAGIGLAFCKDVMLGFGGTITCRSEHGAWTEFELSFPVSV
jgi:two-component system CAI-1 autoinducer sensor kinase/phosphatase CqsS